MSELGEELVLVKEHYVTCNEEKTRLEKELEVLKQDYQAVTHQPYFVSTVLCWCHLVSSLCMQFEKQALLK